MKKTLFAFSAISILASSSIAKAPDAFPFLAPADKPNRPQCSGSF